MQKRILIVDDDKNVWNAYKSVLAPEEQNSKTMLESLLDETLDDAKDNNQSVAYTLTFMSQGEEACRHIEEQKKQQQFYSIAFIDVRMPPGWDGITTAQKMTAIDKEIEIVIVTAYTDISRENIVKKIGRPEKLLYLRKPFDGEELSQIALQLTTKRQLFQQEKKQQQAIERLLEENKRVRRFLDNIISSMPSMLIGVSKEGRVTHWNTQMEHFTGISKQQALGQRVQQLLPELDEMNMLIYASIKQGSIQKQERVKLCYQDKQLLCDILVYPMSSQNVEYDDVVVRIDDITERVRLEEAMLQSDKMLTVGGLAAGMAHEINTPLGSIIQNTQLISHRIAPENKKNQYQAEQSGTTVDAIYDYLDKRGIIQLLEGIRSCGSRTSKIVKSMLTFSHQSNTLMEEYLPDLVEEAIVLSMNDYDMKKSYHFRDFEICRYFDPSLPRILCERTKIEQVVMNILKNAAQSMQAMPPDHTPKITISLQQENDMVTMQIADNGPGMSKAIQKRIFDPFFTTKDVGVGTGLGLSLSYFIVTKYHKGHIQVQSKLGQGTCFIIQLPL